MNRLSDSLELLLSDGVIDAVQGQLKTGKEAEVWLVEQGGRVVAAKLYKERHARSFRNNAGYREGREVRNSRTRRAMEKGSRFGQAAAEEAWKSAESDSLYKLHAAGVRVPAPILFYEGVLLMDVVVDAEGRPAQRLVDAPPRSAEEARALYEDLRGQVVRMLCADLIHGDLSAYNVLRGEAGPTIIDFPQTLAAARNNRAEFYFRRDLDNVRNFLAGFDRGLNALRGEAHEIWTAYVRRELTPDFVPTGKVTAPGGRAQRNELRRGANGQPAQGGGGPGREGQQGRDGGGFRRNGQQGRKGGGGPRRNGQQGQDGGGRGRSGQPGQGTGRADGPAPRNGSNAPPRGPRSDGGTRRDGRGRDRSQKRSGPEISYVMRPSGNDPGKGR